MSIDKYDLADWRNHPVTVELFKEIELQLLDIKDRMSSDNIVTKLDPSSAMRELARLSGIREGLRLVLEYN